MRKFAALLSAVVGLMSFSACGGDDDSSGGPASNSSSGSGGTYVVGYNGDLSGPFAISGQGAYKGIKAYIAALNEAGGVGGKQIKLVSLDDGGDVKRTTANVQKLLTQEHVQAMLGMSISDLCDATAASFESAKIPIVCTAAGPKTVSPPSPNAWVFQAQASQDHQVTPALDLTERLIDSDKPRVAYIHFDAASHRGFGDAMTAALKKRGWPLVGKQIIPLTAAPDVRAMADKLAQAKPDVIVSLVTDKNAKGFYAQLRADGFKGPIIQNPDVGTSILPAVKDPNLYVMAHEYVKPGPDTPGYSNYEKMLAALKASGVSPNETYVARGYIGALTLGTALKACNACAGDELRKTILAETVPADGITPGDLKFSSTNHSGEQKQAIYQWKDNAITLFDTFDAGMD